MSTSAKSARLQVDTHSVPLLEKQRRLQRARVYKISSQQEGSELGGPSCGNQVGKENGMSKSMSPFT